jgi:hypothetical protein
LKKNTIIDFYATKNYVDLSIDNTYLFEDEDIIKAIIYKNYDYKYDVDFELI